MYLCPFGNLEYYSKNFPGKNNKTNSNGIASDRKINLFDFIKGFTVFFLWLIPGKGPPLHKDAPAWLQINSTSNKPSQPVLFKTGGLRPAPMCWQRLPAAGEIQVSLPGEADQVSIFF
jgi:hypothetical protein